MSKLRAAGDSPENEQEQQQQTDRLNKREFVSACLKLRHGPDKWHGRGTATLANLDFSKYPLGQQANAASGAGFAQRSACHISILKCYNPRTKQLRLMRPLRRTRHSVTIGFAMKAVGASWTKLMKSHRGLLHQQERREDCGGLRHRCVRCDQLGPLVAKARAQALNICNLRRGSRPCWRRP